MSALSPFDLKIIFTGLCSLVTDQPLSLAPQKMYLVVSDAWDVNPRTLYKGMDGKKYLVRHGCFIQFPARNLMGAQAKAGSMVWYPKRHVLNFQITEGGGADNTFSVDPDVRKRVADMSVIASEFPHVGDEVVGNNPPVEILANAYFEKGKVTAVPGEYNAAFEDHLKKSTSVVETLIEKMSYRIVLSLEKITKIDFKATPFTRPRNPRPGNPGSMGADEFTIVGNGSSTVEIVIANACDMNPLGWVDETKIDPTDDPDFKWNYEILVEQRQRLIVKLGDHPLPSPRLTGLGNGRNCYPAFWAI